MIFLKKRNTQKNFPENSCRWRKNGEFGIHHSDLNFVLSWIIFSFIRGKCLKLLKTDWPFITKLVTPYEKMPFPVFVSNFIIPKISRNDAQYSFISSTLHTNSRIRKQWILTRSENLGVDFFNGISQFLPKLTQFFF